MFIIDDLLEEMASENITHFSPYYVCQRAGINDLKSVTEYMLELVGKKLKVYFEVECPDGDSDFAVNSPIEISQLPRRCSVCNIEYIPSLDKVWVAFDFTNEYLDHVKKKQSLKMKKNQLLLTT